MIMSWQKLRMMVLERDLFVCSYCCDPATQVDHVIPVCQGGTNHPRNLLASCARCNQSKGGLTAEQWFNRDKFQPPYWWNSTIRKAA